MPEIYSTLYILLINIKHKSDNLYIYMYIGEGITVKCIYHSITTLNIHVVIC